MNVKLHANATTTPRTRAYIRTSRASITSLARELGVSARTVARWKGRDDVRDRSHVPHRLATTMTAWEEALAVELRRTLGLALDDILEAMRRCVNPNLSRSGLHRCLKRHGVSARLTPDKAPALAFETTARPALSTSMSNTCRRWVASAPMPMSRSAAPPASSTSKSCPIAAALPPPASSIAFSPASR
jgi:transposase-like protein